MSAQTDGTPAAVTANDASRVELWPELPVAAWKDTYATLHMWTQIVGKIRMELSPMVNHWWHVPLYVTPRGLTTSSIPYGHRTFEIWFDFLAHELRIETCTGASHALTLEPRSVADFYREVMAALRSLDIDVTITTLPCEVPDPIPFDHDTTHASYDPIQARRFWQILVQSDRIMQRFRSRFTGKSSPVHFFWGSFDLAVTRFSGRTAPPHPGAPNISDTVTREAYSHEVSSCGLWPGGAGVESPVFYAYAYPEPEGFKDYPVGPAEAFYSAEMREYFLPYDAVRTAADPDATLLEFLQTTYEAAAERAGWDRAALERGYRVGEKG